MADMYGPGISYDEDRMKAESVPAPSVEDLGQRYGEITSKIEELLMAREELRKQFMQKHQMNWDMFNAIQERFTQRTGMDQKESSGPMPPSLDRY